MFPFQSYDMTEYEDLINILLDNSELNKKEIKKLINEKKEKVGAGYLTDQGALFLLASDLGINLSHEITKPRTIEFDELEIKTVPKESLENKFQSIKTEKRKRGILSGLSPVSMMILMFGTLIILTNANELNNYFWISVIAVGISGSYLLYLVIKKPIPKLTKQENMYFEIFEFYQKLLQYKHRTKQMKMDSFITKVDEFADYLFSWTEFAPQDISDIVELLINNLRKKIIPFFKQNDEKRILSFLDDYEKFVMFCYVHEPTIEILTKFGMKLETSASPKILEENKKSVQSENQKLLIYEMASPFVGIVVGLTMYSIDATRIFDSLGYGFISGIMVFIGILTVVKIKK